MMTKALRIALIAAAIAFTGHAEAARKRKPAEEQPPAAQPEQLGQFGDWSAFQVGRARGRSCFAISSPKDRKPERLQRDPATFFITRRPGEGVRNEISLIVGFPMKEGTGGVLKIGRTNFALYTKEANAWVKNAEEDGNVVASMRKGSSLIFEGTSKRGNKTVDRYSLSGVKQAIEAITKACP